MTWRASAALIAATTFILLIPTLENGFPFVMHDTWAYIEHGRLFSKVWDRPAHYGLFVAFSTLRLSLWFTAIVQSLLTALVITSTFRLLTTVKHPPVAALVVAAILTATTGLGFNAGLLLPDFFALLCFIAFIVILVAPAALIRGRDHVLLGAVFVWGNMSHLAHLNSATLLLLGALAYRLLASRLRLPQIAWRRVGLVAALVGGSWLGVPTVHALLGEGFTIAPGSPAYLLARMAENGILNRFLRRECPHEGWKLCDQQGTIPEDTVTFLWGPTPDSPLKRNGGVSEENMAEFRDIFLTSLTRPRWLAEQVGEAGIATLRQLVMIDPAVLIVDPVNDIVARTIRRWFPGDHGEYVHSRQYLKKLSSVTEWLPRLNFYVVVGSLVLLIWVFARSDLRAEVRAPLVVATVFVTMSLLANAVSCGALSLPHDRYQSRVIPLVPLLAALVLSHAPLREAIRQSWLRRGSPRGGPEGP